jgi:hypothetical protein
MVWRVQHAVRRELHAGAAARSRNRPKRACGVAEDAVIGLRGRSRTTDLRGVTLTSGLARDADHVIACPVRNGDRHAPPGDEEENRDPARGMTIYAGEHDPLEPTRIA